ncbi:hypothetical protein JTB14_038429 [Gonioctena quinquepunctata]|nr:hypothetical protein JTB14_038429 [Gonioctena quinquepunctata]
MSEDIHLAASNVVKTNIFPNLRNGPTKETIRYDKLLIMYANDLCMEYRSQHHYPMIRNRISTIASVLINIRDKDSSVRGMIDLMNPGNLRIS